MPKPNPFYPPLQVFSLFKSEFLFTSLPCSTSHLDISSSRKTSYLVPLSMFYLCLSTYCIKLSTSVLARSCCTALSRSPAHIIKYKWILIHSLSPGPYTSEWLYSSEYTRNVFTCFPPGRLYSEPTNLISKSWRQILLSGHSASITQEVLTVLSLKLYMGQIGKWQQRRALATVGHREQTAISEQ